MMPQLAVTIAKMLVYITDTATSDTVKQLITDKTGLASSSYKVMLVPKILHNESGKV